MAAGKGKAAPRKKSAALRYRRIVPPSLARGRAYHPKPAGRCVVRRRLFPPSGDSWSEVREGGAPSEAPGPNAVANAIGYAQHYSRSHDAVMRGYAAAGNRIETHEHAGDFKEG